MAVPKRKQTPSKSKMRRQQHDKVVPVQLVPCDHCSAPALPHRACSACGYYKGRKIIAQKVDAAAEPTEG